MFARRVGPTLLFEGHAQVVLNDSDGAFQTYSFSQWRDFSDQEPHPETISTVSFKIRVPRVILLVMFDRLPKKEVKFTRHNILSGTAIPVNTADIFSSARI